MRKVFVSLPPCEAAGLEVELVHRGAVHSRLEFWSVLKQIVSEEYCAVYLGSGCEHILLMDFLGFPDFVNKYLKGFEAGDFIAVAALEAEDIVSVLRGWWDRIEQIWQRGVVVEVYRIKGDGK